VSPSPPSPPSPPPARTVSLVTLGCARNEVDSEELAARLTASGWELTSDDDASVVLVNTCGFIQAAKQESIDELLAAASSGARVAAVGCLAERYGAELAGELPEAQVLSFDDYGEIGARLDDVLVGRKRPAHVARPRRSMDGSRRRRVPAAAVRWRGGAAEDRVRLRPPVLILRDPVLPRRVRLPPPARDPGRGPLAGRQ
jgi:tRNA A37 methylthiotransferase MiaB